MTNSFEDFIERRRREALARISRIPIATLIWGPNPSAGTRIAQARLRLRDELNGLGHYARFSEELIDSSSSHSIIAQQMSHVEAFDIVVSIPDSPGSIAEIHDFARIPEVAHKVIAFVDSDWNNGYSNQSLIQHGTNVTCQVNQYQACNLPDCVLRPVLELIRRLQEVYYLNGRRF